MLEQFGARERGSVMHMGPFVAFCDGKLDDLERQMAGFFAGVCFEVAPVVEDQIQVYGSTQATRVVPRIS